MEKTERIFKRRWNKKMKTKKIYTIVGELLLAFDIFFRRVVLEQPNLFGLTDLAFLFGIFTPLVNSDKKKKYYKIAFVMLAILSLVNEGIVKNYGGDNWANFGFDFLMKLLSGIIIFSYLKHINNGK